MTRIGLNCAAILCLPMQDGTMDLPRMVEHAQWVLANGADGVTLFGTTGEGASIGLGDRYAALGAMAGAGIDMRRKVAAGVSASSEEDIVAQCEAAYAMDCRAILLAPPFYFRGVSDDALFKLFSSVIHDSLARKRAISSSTTSQA